MLPKVNTVARLTRDVELSFTPSQKAVAKFGIAADAKYGDKTTVCFLDCVAWGKTGEAIAKYFVKGKPIIVDGLLKTESWPGQDGQKRSKHVLTVNDWGFVPKDNTQAPKSEEPAEPTESTDDIPF